MWGNYPIRHSEGKDMPSLETAFKDTEVKDFLISNYKRNCILVRKMDQSRPKKYVIYHIIILSSPKHPK